MMSDDARGRWSALLACYGAAAFGPCEYVGQESTVRASEIRALAAAARIGPGARVADLCCGTGGPGVLIARESGCALVGVDRSPEAASLAARRAAGGGLAGRTAFVAGDAARPPLSRRFDAVLLLETLLAIEDKAALIGTVCRLLPLGGRFAFTLEEGALLGPVERSALPADEPVWLITETAMERMLDRAGFAVTWRSDWTAAHLAVTERLIGAFCEGRGAIVAAMGEPFWRRRIEQHEQFARWMASGRLRKLAIVAERFNPPFACGPDQAGGGRWR